MPWAGLRLAVTLLTAVPLAPQRDRADQVPTRGTVAAAMCWAPLVGLALGAVAAGVLTLAARYGHAGPLLASVLAIAALAALTRALHLDGLADYADGLGSGKPAAAALAIMKRSDIGPFGVVTVTLTLLVQVSALARAQAIGRGPLAVIAAALAARLAITLACRRGVRSARPDGLGALVAGSVHPAVAAALCAAGIVAAAACGWIFAVAIAAALAVSVAATALAGRRLGGITGDVLGAVAELAAAACLVVTALS
jgi:adenosylcobinamide-GDP ribazoletransferase